MPSAGRRIRVVFLCTGNSCRSQMAEGFLRSLAGDRFESLSGGSKPAGFVHPVALRVMEEAGVDISGQGSKDIRRFLPPHGTPPDVLVTLCDFAARKCPAFPRETRRLRWPFFDPTLVTGTEEEVLLAFRWVRNQIRTRIERALQRGEFDLPPDPDTGGSRHELGWRNFLSTFFSRFRGNATARR